MATVHEDTSVTYEDLNDLNAEFDDVDTELLRQEVQLKKGLYEKRQKVVSQIPNFWPLVLEQAPPDIDEYIQPSDSALLLSSLTALSVSHFEVEDGGKGDPRSLSIKFEFTENDYFEDSVIEKKFWYRKSADGWTGLVSEPVDIKWKKGKDLTDGLLSMVKKVWEAEQGKAEESNGASAKKPKTLTADQTALKKKMESTGLGGLSFFAWFGYIGKYITAEESLQATEKAKQQRAARQAGKAVENGEEENEAEEEEDDDELELFPDGENLAVAIAEDLWPGAIKYFIQAQEQDVLSDADFESDEEEMDEDEDDEPPSKKRKA